MKHFKYFVLSMMVVCSTLSFAQTITSNYSTNWCQEVTVFRTFYYGKITYLKIGWDTKIKDLSSFLNNNGFYDYKEVDFKTLFGIYAKHSETKGKFSNELNYSFVFKEDKELYSISVFIDLAFNKTMAENNFNALLEDFKTINGLEKPLKVENGMFGGVEYIFEKECNDAYKIIYTYRYNEPETGEKVIIGTCGIDITREKKKEKK